MGHRTAGSGMASNSDAWRDLSGLPKRVDEGVFMTTIEQVAQRLREIIERCEKATKGPWGWQLFGDEWFLTGQYGCRPIIFSRDRKKGFRLRDGERDLLVPFTN